MDRAGFSNIQLLSDLELAIFLCLAAEEHCLIETKEDLLDDLCHELALIASDHLKLSYVVLSRESYCSNQKFLESISASPASSLQDLGRVPQNLDHNSQGNSSAKASDSADAKHDCSAAKKTDTQFLVNIIIAQDFNIAPACIQLQAVEFIRTRKVSTAGTTYTAPKAFLLLPVIPKLANSPSVNKHLVDHIFISHYHEPDHGFPNLEGLDNRARTARTSSSASSSALRSSFSRPTVEWQDRPTFSTEDVTKLQDMAQSTSISAEVKRYLHDIIVFLRLERGVLGGVSPRATKHFEKLTRYLAPLHNLDYVTPSLVALASKKVYGHRVVLCDRPEQERSMQYGSDLAAVKEYLDNLTVDEVIGRVLDAVKCPL